MNHTLATTAPLVRSRVLFAFDPPRMAILLMGGDKSRRCSSWYAEAIPAADQLYDEPLQTLRDEGAIP
jgi:hypothetical protein